MKLQSLVLFGCPKFDGEAKLIIVAIHWKIKPDKVDRFLEFWKQEAVVHDRSGLVGEFLTEAHSTAEYDWITWHLTGCEGKYRSFINVGYWDSAEKFHEQIGKYFKTSKDMEDFEYELRVRTVLKPKHWRMGDASLPKSSTGGVV